METRDSDDDDKKRPARKRAPEDVTDTGTHDRFSNNKGMPAKKEQRKKIKRKPKDMPRRPLSAYNIFFREQRALILQESKDRAANESSLFVSMAKIVAERWRELPAEEVAKYRGLANEDADRHRQEMEAYQEKVASQHSLPRPQHQAHAVAAASSVTSLGDATDRSAELKSDGGAAVAHPEPSSNNHSSLLPQSNAPSGGLSIAQMGPQAESAQTSQKALTRHASPGFSDGYMGNLLASQRLQDHHNIQQLVTGTLPGSFNLASNNMHDSLSMMAAASQPLAQAASPHISREQAIALLQYRQSLQAAGNQNFSQRSIEDRTHHSLPFGAGGPHFSSANWLQNTILASGERRDEPTALEQLLSQHQQQQRARQQLERLITEQSGSSSRISEVLSLLRPQENRLLPGGVSNSHMPDSIVAMLPGLQNLEQRQSQTLNFPTEQSSGAAGEAGPLLALMIAEQQQQRAGVLGAQQQRQSAASESSTSELLLLMQQQQQQQQQPVPPSSVVAGSTTSDLSLRHQQEESEDEQDSERETG